MKYANRLLLGKDWEMGISTCSLCAELCWDGQLINASLFAVICVTSQWKGHWLSEPGNLGPIHWVEAKDTMAQMYPSSFKGDTGNLEQSVLIVFSCSPNVYEPLS